MQIKPFQPPARTLMGPGPADVHPRVLEAMARPTIGHLDPRASGCWKNSGSSSAAA
jgi:alanine-glyoxylate transaminase / serine-glyoxylate transaminase / serine-pyruvate transaminase